MPFEFSREDRPAYLLFRLSGPTTTANMIDLADRLRAAVDETGLACLLLDCGGMTGQVSLAELYKVSEYFALVLGSGIKLAAVQMPPQWQHNQFSEDVVFIRGGLLRHFASVESAEAWFAQE
jgi:hypothetical protein